MRPIPVLLNQIIWIVGPKHLCLKKTPRWFFSYSWLKKNTAGKHHHQQMWILCVCVWDVHVCLYNSTMVCFKSQNEFSKYLSLIKLCPITIHQWLFREWKLISILVLNIEKQYWSINKWAMCWVRDCRPHPLAISRLEIIWTYFLFLSYFLN